MTTKFTNTTDVRAVIEQIEAAAEHTTEYLSTQNECLRTRIQTLERKHQTQNDKIEQLERDIEEYKSLLKTEQSRYSSEKRKLLEAEECIQRLQTKLEIQQQQEQTVQSDVSMNHSVFSEDRKLEEKRVYHQKLLEEKENAEDAVLFEAVHSFLNRSNAKSKQHRDLKALIDSFYETIKRKQGVIKHLHRELAITNEERCNLETNLTEKNSELEKRVATGQQHIETIKCNYEILLAEKQKQYDTIWKLCQSQQNN